MINGTKSIIILSIVSILIIGALSSVTLAQNESIICSDSDNSQDYSNIISAGTYDSESGGGIDIYVQGQINFRYVGDTLDRIEVDKCEDIWSNTPMLQGCDSTNSILCGVRENYCWSGGGGDLIFTCPGGCKNGACLPYETSCSDGVDNDDDNLIDCNDPDCIDDPACVVEEEEYEEEYEICDDGIDNDGNTFIDCDDPKCKNYGGCIGAPSKVDYPPEICNDGIDNDGDEKIDCEDLDCSNAENCITAPPLEPVEATPQIPIPGQEICNDKIDNDNDGYVDCYDNDCKGALSFCGRNPQVKQTICYWGFDTDGDGLIDCEDPDCSKAQICIEGEIEDIFEIPQEIVIPPGKPISYVCGNGILEPGEQCDDGNRVNGDGCSSSCQKEIATPPKPVKGPPQVPIPQPDPTPLICDPTAQAIVTAVGGCSEVDPNVYQNIYNACCRIVTKETLLSQLNDALADGVVDKNEKLGLLYALNVYLS